MKKEENTSQDNENPNRSKIKEQPNNETVMEIYPVRGRLIK